MTLLPSSSFFVSMLVLKWVPLVRQRIVKLSGGQSVPSPQDKLSDCQGDKVTECPENGGQSIRVSIVWRTVQRNMYALSVMDVPGILFSSNWIHLGQKIKSDRQ